MAKPIHIGDRFHYWTVISDPESKRQKRYVLTRCECGTEKTLTTSSLFQGLTRSCGCAPMSIYKDVLETMIEPITETGCWIWMGSLDVHGYGVCNVESCWPMQRKSHRVFYEAFKHQLGKYFACHKCDVTECVNPDHLYPGTQPENMADMKRRGRHLVGAKIRAAKIIGERHYKTRFTAADILSIRADSRSAHEIAKDFNVGTSTIHAIWTRQNWKHI